MSNRSRSKIKFWIIYLLVTITVVVFALEGVVRLLHLAPPLINQFGKNVEDPYLPHKPQPLSMVSGRSATDEFDFEYTHNSFGFRDVEHTIQKPERTFRILGLGDSFTYGAGVAFEETYLRQLERMLNDRAGEHPRVEIIKAGIGRYFPEPERLLLQHYGVDYEPDLIIVGLLPNDVIDTFSGLDATKVAKNGYLVSKEASEVGLGGGLYIRSHVFRIVLRKYMAFVTLEKQQPQPAELYKPNGFHEREWQKIEEEYEKMIELAGQVGAKIVFVSIPQRGPWDDTASYPATRLSQWGAEHSVPIIDILPAMKDASENEMLYWEKDGHCNSAGYRVIAETIYSVVIEAELVP